MIKEKNKKDITADDVIIINDILNKFSDYLETWVDLPPYVHTKEYKKAFINFLLGAIRNNKKLDKDIAVAILHHEMGNRLPYFSFDRK